jgi:hypothetical protein
MKKIRKIIEKIIKIKNEIIKHIITKEPKIELTKIIIKINKSFFS